MRLQPWLRCLGVAISCCVALTGCGAGQVHNAPPPSPTSAPGNVHLTDYAATDGRTSRVILSGAVGDFGVAQRGANDRLTLHLSHGTFQLDATNVDHGLLMRLRDLRVDQQTCSSEATATGHAAIVAGSGTGTYSKISGSFQLTITLDEVYRAGQCRETAPFRAQAIVTSGWGDVSFG